MSTFIEKIKPYAQDLGKQYNILPSVLIAQACLESNYGKSGLATKGFNLFGVKGSYKGQSVTMSTKEQRRDGTEYTIQAAFRKYPSYKESIKDLCELYKNGVSWDHNKYRRVIGETNYVLACAAIQESGYATDIHYAAKLVKTIELNRLERVKTTVKPAVKAAVKPAVKIASSSYIVKHGDSLSKILGTNDKDKIMEVVKKNKLLGPNKIFAGQKLIL